MKMSQYNRQRIHILKQILKFTISSISSFFVFYRRRKKGKNKFFIPKNILALVTVKHFFSNYRRNNRKGGKSV